MTKGKDEAAGDSDLAYFRAVEEAFLRLRGAPLTLGPADYAVARGWREARIPVWLVEEALEEVFARRAERKARGRINSLRYCASAVEEAWDALQEIRGPGATGREVGDREAGPGGEAAEAVVDRQRLEELAAGLPAGLPGREEVAARIRSFAGPAAAADRALADLEATVLAAAEAALAEDARKRLDRRVEEAVARLHVRFGEEELARLRRELWRKGLREELGLPPLRL